MRATRLALVVSENRETAQSMVMSLRREGVVAFSTHSADGCLRMATSVSPDLVLLDPALPHYLEDQLRAHPTSAAADIHWLAAPSVEDILPPLTTRPHHAPAAA